MAVFTKTKITTAVEISKKYVKLVQISSTGAEVSVTACVCKEFSPVGPDSAAEALRQIIKEHNIKIKSLIISIPRQNVTTKNLKLPSQNPKEIEEMAGFQAVKQIPYPKEEISYGCYSFGVDAEGYSKIILVICNRAVVDQPLAITKECGLSPEKAALSSLGLLNWFNLNENLRKKSEKAPLMLVDSDIDSTDIAIVSNGKLIYTRGLTFGYTSGADEGQGYEKKLADEITKTLSTYGKEEGSKWPAEVVFTGNLSDFEKFKRELELSLNTKIEYAGTFDHIPLHIVPEFKTYTTQVSYSSLIGAALDFEAIDLLPKEVKAAKAARVIKNEITISAILILAVIASLSLTIWNKILQKEATLKTLESKLRLNAPEVQEIERMRTVSQVVKSQLNKKSEALNVLKELSDIIPPQIYLTLYTYDEEKVEIKGAASVLSDVFRLVKTLEDSLYFQNVQVRYATKRKTEGREIVDFDISCSLSAEAKQEKWHS